MNNRTVEPTQIAGFNQFFDDINATKSTRYGAGLDWSLNPALTLGVKSPGAISISRCSSKTKARTLKIGTSNCTVRIFTGRRPRLGGQRRN